MFNQFNASSGTRADASNSATAQNFAMSRWRTRLLPGPCRELYSLLFLRRFASRIAGN